MNPSGGLSSFGEAIPAQAIAQVCELVWQLRGQATGRQVEGARVGRDRQPGPVRSRVERHRHHLAANPTPITARHPRPRSASMPDVALLEVVDHVATVTLNRPEARNALSTELIRALSERVARSRRPRRRRRAHPHRGRSRLLCRARPERARARRRPSQARAGRRRLSAVRRDNQGDRAGAPPRRGRGPTLPTSKPIIGAVNGVAVTGGLELALQCDFLVASERARFADTHARVGVHPLWGLTVLLPQAVGMRRAREMSATGNFVDAATALAWGLVNHVVAHDELLPTARRLAADIVTSDQRAVRAILAHLRRGESGARRQRPGTSKPAPRRSSNAAASTPTRSSDADGAWWTGVAPRSESPTPTVP